MIKYWTTWNFVWFIGSKNGYFQINNALRISILTTSLLGGYMAYIYPRKMILYIRDYRYNLPYPLLLTGDLIFHQLPLFYILHSENTENTCAATKIIGLEGSNFISAIKASLDIWFLSSEKALITSC